MLVAAESSIKLIQCVNNVCEWLARRDIQQITAKEVQRTTNLNYFDALFAFGCDLTEIPEFASKVYHMGLCRTIVFSGGIGHGTEGLRINAKGKYGIHLHNSTEAEIMAAIASEFCGVPSNKILIEDKSTNTSENALFSLDLLTRSYGKPAGILLVQDPLAQQRSHLTLMRYTDEDTKLISFAPFIPHYIHNKPWAEERFFDLIFREVTRIGDDENGYGPKGKNYIAHIDIPESVLESYRYIQNFRLKKTL
jgi:hypothetical protein